MSLNLFNFDENTELSLDDSRLIDKLEFEIQESFNGFISKLNDLNELKSFSLLLSNSCRNTYTSEVYRTFSRVILLEAKLKNNNYPSKIIVPNQEVYLIAAQIVKKHSKDIEIEIINTERSISIKILKNILVSGYLQLAYYLFSRLLGLKKIPKEPIVFLDTFIFKDSFNEDGSFHDRYYTGYENFLTEEEGGSIWYSPTIIDIKSPRDLLHLWKRQKKSKKNFICEESWLGIFDYSYSFLLSFFLPSSIKNIPRYKNLDVAGYIKKELKKEICSPGLIKAINKYLYIRSLSRKVKVKKVINWHENHNIDRALNMAFKKFNPDVSVFGYQGYVSPRSDLHKNPIDFEYRNKTLPDVLGVLSEEARIYKLGICKDLKINISPALRFSYLHDLEKKIDYSLNSHIFVPLSADLADASRLIKFCSTIGKKLIKNYKIVFKIHPKYTKKDYLNLIPALGNDLFEISESSVEENIKKSCMLFSSSSTACVEACAVGIPVSILSNSHGITMNPIASFTEDECRIIYTEEDLLEFLEQEKDLKDQSIERFFHKVIKEEVREIFLP